MVAPTAILDIGSNTVRLFLNEAAAGHIPEGPRFSTVVGLRRGAAPDGSLAAESLLRLDACLANFGERAAAAGAHLGMAIGTSAVRDAPNRDAVALLVARHAGLPLTVISGAVEAELSFRGAAIAVDDTGPRLVVDVGGATMEPSGVSVSPGSLLPVQPAAEPTTTRAPALSGAGSSTPTAGRWWNVRPPAFAPGGNRAPP